MAKIIATLCLIILLCSCDSISVPGIGVVIPPSSEGRRSDVDSAKAYENVGIQVPPKKLTLQDVYRSQEGLTELTGNNDGPHIVAYHLAAGLDCPSGCPYCASGVRWTFEQVGIPTTISAWSPTAHNKKNVVFDGMSLLKEPRTGDVITLYYKNLGRIGHTGFFDSRINEDVVQTFEFNTNSVGSRDGGGNYFKKRPLRTLNSITRWTEN